MGFYCVEHRKQVTQPKKTLHENDNPAVVMQCANIGQIPEVLYRELYQYSTLGHFGKATFTQFNIRSLQTCLVSQYRNSVQFRQQLITSSNSSPCCTYYMSIQCIRATACVGDEYCLSPARIYTALVSASSLTFQDGRIQFLLFLSSPSPSDSAYT